MEGSLQHLDIGPGDTDGIKPLVRSPPRRSSPSLWETHHSGHSARPRVLRGRRGRPNLHCQPAWARRRNENSPHQRRPAHLRHRHHHPVGRHRPLHRREAPPHSGGHFHRRLPPHRDRSGGYAARCRPEDRPGHHVRLHHRRRPPRLPGRPHLLEVPSLLPTGGHGHAPDGHGHDPDLRLCRRHFEVDG